MKSYTLVPFEIRYKPMHWFHSKSGTNLVPVEIRYKPMHWFHSKSGTNLYTGSC